MSKKDTKNYTPPFVDVVIRKYPHEKYIEVRKKLQKDGYDVRAYQPGYYSDTGAKEIE